MSKLFSQDKALFATFGKCKDGTYSATVNMAAHGDDYPAFGIDKAEGFMSLLVAKLWAEAYMDTDEDEPFEASKAKHTEEAGT